MAVFVLWKVFASSGDRRAALVKAIAVVYIVVRVLNIGVSASHFCNMAHVFDIRFPN